MARNEALTPAVSDEYICILENGGTAAYRQLSHQTGWRDHLQTFWITDALRRQNRFLCGDLDEAIPGGVPWWYSMVGSVRCSNHATPNPRTRWPDGTYPVGSYAGLSVYHSYIDIRRRAVHGGVAVSLPPGLVPDRSCGAPPYFRFLPCSCLSCPVWSAVSRCASGLAPGDRAGESCSRRASAAPVSAGTREIPAAWADIAHAGEPCRGPSRNGLEKFSHRVVPKRRFRRE